MEISLTLLESYFRKTKYPINIAVSIQKPFDATLVFIAGESQEGSRREYIDYSDLNDILVANNILGDTGLLRKELEQFQTELKSGNGNRNMRAENMESLVYETLRKYIYQLLNASMGQVFFPEIVPLKKHLDYFREHSTVN
ncbi:MAG: hypothetical protein RL204_1122 [Bacteroidota bacterium]|jgi:type I restriction-modification system DNA methylase subunit